MNKEDREREELCNYRPAHEKNKVFFYWVPVASVLAVLGWYAQELLRIHDMLNEVMISHRDHEKRVEQVAEREEKLDDVVTKILQRLSSIEAKIEPKSYKAYRKDDDA